MKLFNFFNKKKKKNIKKRSGKKRQIIVSALLAWKLFFGDFRETPNDLTPLTHEKGISNQELNSFEDYQNSGTIIRTGNGTILEVRQEVSDLSSNEILSEYTLNETDEVILVKNDKILPEANGYSQAPYWRHPLGPPRIRPQETLPVAPQNPQNIKGIGNVEKAPSVRGFKDIDSGLDGRRGNRGDACPAPEINMDKKFRMFMEDMAKKNLSPDCDPQRFNELSIHSEKGVFTEQSIAEARGVLQAEAEGMFFNTSRPSNPKVKIDFEAYDRKTGAKIFVDHKAMIDLKSIALKKGKSLEGYPSHEEIAFNMGKDIVAQKERHLNFIDGPKSAKDVLHVVDFCNIKDPIEKKILVDKVLSGAESAGSTDNIRFINFD